MYIRSGSASLPLRARALSSLRFSYIDKYALHLLGVLVRILEDGVSCHTVSFHKCPERSSKGRHRDQEHKCNLVFER